MTPTDTEMLNWLQEQAKKFSDREIDYAEWIEEVLNHKDIPEFQKLLIREKIDNDTLRGSDLRCAYQSGGMMPPTDLIGLP